MSRFDELCSRKNLELAWRRIGTGTSHFYKRFFRRIYNTYALGLEQNLRDLSIRLKGGSYVPQTPIRIYTPKPSGLQRPITLLSVEDQIVWQAAANIFALKLKKRRKKLQFKGVFSNVLTARDTDLFFLEPWHYCYSSFQERIGDYYRSGYRWIGHFDLAAFYDTICHELLLRAVVRGRIESRFRNTIMQCLEKWSCEHSAGQHKHGIPQGLMASDFLADCFMLDIDEALYKEFNYVRYCDDIRLFAKTEGKAQKAAIRLEVLCRERGLIPQGKKFAISEAKALRDAMGSLPSIDPAGKSSTERGFSLSASKGVALFKSALDKRPIRIADKSRARYAIFHSEPSEQLLKYILKLLPHHPEHIDAFAFYLEHYKRSKRIIRVCSEQMKITPYEYVKAELWHILARMMKQAEMRSLIRAARRIATSSESCFALKWGVCHFLCKAENLGFSGQSKYIVRQKNAHLKALLSPVLPDSFYLPNAEVARLLRAGSYEPGLSLAPELIARDLTCRDYGVKASELANQTRNTFKALGLIKVRQHTIDPMGEVLAARFGIPQWTEWRKLFQKEYWHALRILISGDPLYDSAKSEWLKYQNSFNHALFLSLQGLLHKKNLPGKATLIDRHGNSVKFGVMVSKGQPFHTAYPKTAEALKECNDRRNKLPGSHPYDNKGQKTNFLRRKEQTRIYRSLKKAYKEIVCLAQTHL